MSGVDGSRYAQTLREFGLGEEDLAPWSDVDHDRASFLSFVSSGRYDVTL